ncbi:MAG: Crp/Fnr family transcriptional regulator [Prevotella sp.]|jgi:CRP-like cAMP-binding protein|nr:Crp/Fnr family transcriptional regulator [Prevotella sp.]
MLEELVIKYLSDLIPITDDLKKIIIENSIFKTFKKGTLLLKEGNVSDECYFILKGCIKRYYVIDGEEKITGFYIEKQIVTPSSYNSGQPSKYNLSCLEDTIVATSSLSIEKDLYSKYPQLESMTRILGDLSLQNLESEFDNWVCVKPQNRYIELMNKRPDLCQRVPQYQLANFLGLKPQSLSRIRKRLANSRSL